MNTNTRRANERAMHDLFDNIFWHTLTGPQARFAAGAGGARRYVAGCSPIIGFADQQQPDFAALAPYCEADEHFYTEGWSGPVPGWLALDAETAMIKMIWDAPPPGPDAGSDAVVTLGPEHVQRAVESRRADAPGPVRPAHTRTRRLHRLPGRRAPDGDGRSNAPASARCARSAASARIPTSRATVWRGV